ncbi:MAG: efflux RND transporter permease subunit [Methyloceanibacter sp.]
MTLVGLVGCSRLSVREYPNIDAPVVTVTTSYPGASAAIVETQVTKVLEDSLSGIEGIDYLTSMSRQEESQITIRFKLERDPDDAAADVRDRTARVRGHLPDEIDEPVIQKVEADAQPILYIASPVTGTRRWKLPTMPNATSRTSSRRLPVSPM